jgi:glucosyl-dolichyl phosphate glucuronosyltransferase
VKSSTGILLSIVIPTRNHAQLVSELLDTFAVQMVVPFQWEVLVVDNGSSDQTAKLAKQKFSSLPIDIRYIHEPRLGLHYGRHRGALEARGRFLAYLDDDVLLTPAWIQGAERLISGQAEAVVGRILPKWEARPPAWLRTLSHEPGFLSLLDMGPTGFYIDPKFVYGDNFFIATQTLLDLKGFHPDGMPTHQLRYRGDGEYGLMLKFTKAGLRAWYEPIATVYHRIPRERMTMEYLFNRSFAQGISDSFTEIRSKQYDPTFLLDHNIRHHEVIRRPFPFYMRRIKELPLRRILSNLLYRVMKHVPLTQHNIKIRLNKALMAGYEYHQAEVRRDPQLLQWVLQMDYWNSSL